jgi:hypothetical protein
MSEGPTACRSEPTRLPWLACLSGWLTSTALGWLALLIFIELDNARLDEGHAFEDDAAVPPPALFSSEWLQNAALAYPKLLVVALVYAIPLLLLIARLERRADRSPQAISLSSLVIPPVIVTLLGVAGGGSARLVRNRQS